MRAWERFLTERDRQHLAEFWQKPRPFGLGRHPVVLVIDNCWASLGQQRLPLLEAARRWPKSCGLEGWDAIDQTRLLLDSARAGGIEVVYTTLRDSTRRPEIAPSELPQSVPAEWRGRQYEIVDVIAPQPGESLIEKSAASAFFATGLLGLLIRKGIDTLIVCGNSTSGCVRASVVDASSLGFRVGVVEECTFDRTEASHAINLFDIDRKYADVMSLGDTLDYVSTLCESR
jgi:nicotinamidase-related amidase